MTNIKWLFFDVGSTLVDESKCIEARINTILNANQIDEFEFKSKVLEYAVIDCDPVKSAAKFFGVNIPDWNKKLEFLYPDTKTVIRKLSLKYKLGIIANQSLGTKQRLNDWSIGEYFDVIIASAEENCEKPNLEIFERAIKRANCKAEESVMIGDRLDNDIIPANKIGMKTVWVKQGFAKYHNIEKPNKKPDYTVDTLSQLLSVL